MDKDKKKHKSSVFNELVASCYECDDGALTVILVLFLICFIFGVVYIVVVYSEDGDALTPARPFIYYLPYVEQKKIARKLGVKSVYPRGARQLKANNNLTFAFELAFATRIASSAHVAETVSAADLLFLGFYPMMTQYCYTAELCQGDQFQPSFDEALRLYRDELAKLDSRVPVFVGIGQSNPPLMRLLVSRWRRSLIFVTPYNLEADETVQVVDGLTYTTIVTALPDLNVCGARCVRRLREENLSVMGELARKEGETLGEPAQEEENEEEFEADEDESKSLSKLLGGTLYDLVYKSSERKEYEVMVATSDSDYPYFEEAAQNMKRMKAVNLSWTAKKKARSKARKRYRSYLKTSKFCIHLFGDIRDVGGFFEGLVGGCIPIIPKSRRWKFPYERSYEWDYSTFSFEVDLKREVSILNYIDSLPTDEVRRKQYALFMVKRRVSWYSSKTYRKHRESTNMRDAFDLTLLEVFYRAVLEPKRLQLDGPCHILSFAFPKLTQMKDLLLPEVSSFLYNCFNISVSPNDFLVNWLDFDYGKDEL